MRRYRAEILASLLLVAVTLSAYARVCGNDFVNLDDADYVTENRPVQAGLTAESIAWAFTTTHAANWHPLTWLSLELDHQLFGMAPWGYHLTNLLLHTANTLLLFLALRRMTGAVWRGAMVAALFAVHPLHVESVAWVAERKDVLSTLFWMLTLLAYAWYAERPGWRRYLLIMLPLALGLMAKPMLVTLPCVLLLLDYWPLRRLWRAADPVPAGGTSPAARPATAWWLLLEKLPLFALVAASCAVTLFAQRPTVIAMEHLPFQFRLANAFTSYADYIGKMFWPTHLAAFYPYPRAWFLWEFLAAAAALVPISILAVARARRQPYLLVGWLWYLGTLVPVIGLVQVGRQQMADRYTYIPLVGLFLLLVWAVADLTAPWPGRRPVLAALSALVLLPCVVLTWRQAATWRDSASLWGHALEVTTDNSDAHVNFGAVLDVQGQTGQAIAHYRRALVITPDHPMAHFNLGAALYRQGKMEEAVPHLQASLQSEAGRARAPLALANALEQMGRLEEARRTFEDILEGDPGNADVHNDVGVVYRRLGKPAEAIRHFDAALAINPQFTEALNNLAGAFAQQGDYTTAVKHLSAAVRVDPNNAVAHCNLGTALSRLGRKAEAAQEYRTALRLQPGHARARQGLEELGAAGQ